MVMSEYVHPSSSSYQKLLRGVRPLDTGPDLTPARHSSARPETLGNWNLPVA